MKALDALRSVLCGPDGKCCIAGSVAGRDIVDAALIALQAERDELRQQLEAAQKDAGRLSWYEKNPSLVIAICNGWYSRKEYGAPLKRVSEIRTAIDAAIAATKGTTK